MESDAFKNNCKPYTRLTGFDHNFLARPEQSLKRHISNMHKQIASINTKAGLAICNIKIPEDYLQDIISLIIVSHDFGKINPLFQWRVSNLDLRKKISVFCMKYSYHSLIGALLSYFLVREYHAQVILNKEKFNVPEDVLEIVTISTTFVVLSHHSRVLSNSITSYLNYKTAIKTAVIINEIVEYLATNNDTEKSNNDELVIKIMKDIINDSLTLNLVDKNNIIEPTLKRFIELKELETLHETFDDLVDKWREIIDSGKGIDTYFLIVSLYSILTDLDEWDAKSSIADTPNHWIDFDLHNVIIKESTSLINKITGDTIDKFRIKVFRKGIIKENDLNNLRNEVYKVTARTVQSIKDKKGKIYLLTAPTGSGKTLAMLNMALKIRQYTNEKYNYQPKIIFALPFISITNQVSSIIRRIFDLPSDHNPLLTTHHHLAEVNWNYLTTDNNNDQQLLEQNFIRASHFVQHWQSEIIVTTFVALWNSILRAKKRNIIRFDKIIGSIIILDEVQGLNVEYWHLLRESLFNLCNNCGCTIILGSATQPRALVDENYNEGIKTKNNLVINTIKDINPLTLEKINRYILYYHTKKTPLDKFISAIGKIIISKNKNLLIVLNTKKSARTVFDRLYPYVKGTDSNTSYYFLSSLVLPNDRYTILNKIEEDLKESRRNNKRVIVVCTQVIEAGVDVDFDHVIRDFAPLDSLIQIAGRCNRENRNKMGGIIEVYKLIKERSGTLYSELVYGLVNLRQTDNILQKKGNKIENDLLKLTEKDLRNLANDFFYNLATTRKTTVGYRELINCQFEELIHKFNLITDFTNVTLIIDNNEHTNNLLTQLQTTLSKKTLKKSKNKRTKSIMKKLFKNSIAISESDLKLLKKICTENNRKLTPLKVFETTNDEKNDKKIFVLEVSKNDTIYSKNGGLKLTEDSSKPDR